MCRSLWGLSCCLLPALGTPVFNSFLPSPSQFFIFFLHVGPAPCLSAGAGAHPRSPPPTVPGVGVQGGPWWGEGTGWDTEVTRYALI